MGLFLEGVDYLLSKGYIVLMAGAFYGEMTFDRRSDKKNIANEIEQLVASRLVGEIGLDGIQNAVLYLK